LAAILNLLKDKNAVIHKRHSTFGLSTKIHTKKISPIGLN